MVSMPVTMPVALERFSSRIKLLKSMLPIIRTPDITAISKDTNPLPLVLLKKITPKQYSHDILLSTSILHLVCTKIT
jgi:hypothetical protein